MQRKRELSLITAALAVATTFGTGVVAGEQQATASAAKAIAEAVSLIQATAPIQGRTFDRMTQAGQYIQVELDRAGIRAAERPIEGALKATSREELQNLRRAQIEVYRALRRLNAGQQDNALSHATYALAILAEETSPDDVEAADDDTKTKQTGESRERGGLR